MDQHTSKPASFWIELERNVSSRVDAALHKGAAPREALIAYLRDFEEMARAECDRRQTVQIIASGRSLLGDRRQLGSSKGPFASAPRA